MTVQLKRKLNTERSSGLFDRAQAHLPGGVDSPVRAWRGVGGDPLFIERGEGSCIYDADGNRLIDYVCSWGPLILGHAHPKVVAAVQAAAARGTSYGAPTALEIELAERITAAVPSIEMLRFVSSGTEATMSAIRVARAFTGRDRIIKFDGGYHGHADFLLARAGSGVATLALPDSAGVPSAVAATTLIANYNDLDSITHLFDLYGTEIAAIIVEPIAGNMGVVTPAPGFLQGLRRLADHHNAVLIFDEVISGFRASYGGAQALYDVRPDLTCLGKIVGGGLPVGAYGGRREIMQMVAPLGPVYQAGTLSGNPLAMAAGIATLDALRETHDAYEQLEARGASLEQGLTGAAREAGIPVTVNRAGSLLTPFFQAGPVTDYASALRSDKAAYARFFHGMLDRGTYLAPSQFEAAFISLAHSDADIAETIAAARETFEEMQ
ncbi:MAG: glutamate-1-semialdehyde 2,1-aminomutase [Rudaea sp.]